MKLVEYIQNYSIDPFKLIESIVHAEGSAVILFKNRKVKYFMSEQFYHKHPQFKDYKGSVLGKMDFDLFPDSHEHPNKLLMRTKRSWKQEKQSMLLKQKVKQKKGTQLLHIQENILCIIKLAKLLEFL